MGNVGWIAYAFPDSGIKQPSLAFDRALRDGDNLMH